MRGQEKRVTEARQADDKRTVVERIKSKSAGSGVLGTQTHRPTAVHWKGDCGGRSGSKEKNTDMRMIDISTNTYNEKS